LLIFLFKKKKKEKKKEEGNNFDSFLKSDNAKVTSGLADFETSWRERQFIIQWPIADLLPPAIYSYKIGKRISLTLSLTRSIHHVHVGFGI
jgi:hypothetical protein